MQPFELNNSKARCGASDTPENKTELKENPNAYDGVEVMACPGGCIGGGGQPLPNTPEIRKQRAEGLYQIDREKKLRLAHENPIIQKNIKIENMIKKKMGKKYDVYSQRRYRKLISGSSFDF
jgi:iron only hydrogenase large subunit-like protein